MKFEYKARNKDGQIKSGSVVASSASQAETLLVENGLIIVELNQQEESLIEHLDLFGGRVSNKDLVLFSRQLATLIAARVPIIQALRILQSQVENKKLISVLKDVVASVENGESFSLALSKHPKIFGNVYVSLVKSGEVSGALNQSLTYLADQLEKDYELGSKVTGTG
jgi:type IV pilus assembly protein PilC